MTGQQPIAGSSATTPWMVLILASIVAGAVWTWVAQSAETVSPVPQKIAIGVGNAVVACLTGSLMGLFAVLKNRDPIVWSLTFGTPALIAGFIPLIVGAIIMAILPKADPLPSPAPPHDDYSSPSSPQ